MVEKKEQVKADYGHFAEFGNDVEGYDGLNMDVMAIPFLRVLQALSPQLKKNKPEYLADAEEGDICNNITGVIYEQPLRIVIGKFERLFIEWKPDRGGFVQAHDPASVENNPQYRLIPNDKGKMELKDQRTGNVLVDTYMYYVLLPDYLKDGICVMALSSSFLKEARKLNRILMNTYIPGTEKKALPHFMIFKLEVVDMSKDQNDWKGPKFTFDGFVTQDLLANVVAERKALPDKKIDFAQIEESAGKSDSNSNNNEEVKY